jgi:cyclic pyranopterin phosphate synthase
MARATLEAICQGRVLKGDVFATARLGAIQAAKRTHEWIPLAHPLPLDWVDVELMPDPDADGGPCVRIEGVARARARTGVEMEALVAVTAAGLVVYDMCKSIDRGMTLEAVRLVRKRGGKSGEWQREGE